MNNKYSNEIINEIVSVEQPEQKFKKATNGRCWYDYQIQQEKRQKEINKIVHEQRPEEISLKETLLFFIVICFGIFLLTHKF